MRKRKVILWGDDMTNGEKYGDEIKKILDVEKSSKDYDFCDEFIKPKILGETSCCGLTCEHCILLQSLWLNEEYKEQGVDWSKVPVDTKILVGRSEDSISIRRHFAKYEDGKIFAFTDGNTSFTVGEDAMEYWKFAKLAEVDDEKP